MYTYEARVRAVQLYIQYDLNMAATIRELGYPSRGMLYGWYKEFKENGGLREDHQLKHLKYTLEQRKQAIEYYLSHGRSISRTIKALGFPKRTALCGWIKEDLPDEALPCATGKTLVRYTQEQKEQAVIQLCSKERTAREISADIGVSESSLRIWKKRLLNERCSNPMPSKRTSASNYKTAALPSQGDLAGEKQVLLQQVDELKRDIFRLQMERDILEKAGEILKEGQGINPERLTNREKVALIDALRDKYQLNTLLSVLSIAKSSYCYQRCAMRMPDKHAALRVQIKKIFAEAYSSYGYRRIHAVVQGEGQCISEKVIRRIMMDEQLVVPSVKKRKYNSYIGEISPDVPNLVNRDFRADAPNAKWLTDITEFSIPAGKVYLSPIIDCFDGMPVAWTIGTSPDAELVHTMLDEAIPLLGESEWPIIHSDRGCHYR
jgi:putative transposase